MHPAPPSVFGDHGLRDSRPREPLQTRVPTVLMRAVTQDAPRPGPRADSCQETRARAGTSPGRSLCPEGVWHGGARVTRGGASVRRATRSPVRSRRRRGLAQCPPPGLSSSRWVWSCFPVASHSPHTCVFFTRLQSPYLPGLVQKDKRYVCAQTHRRDQPAQATPTARAPGSPGLPAACRYVGNQRTRAAFLTETRDLTSCPWPIPSFFLSRLKTPFRPARISSETL